jgi:hypothetical protein
LAPEYRGSSALRPLTDPGALAVLNGDAAPKPALTAAAAPPAPRSPGNVAAPVATSDGLYYFSTSGVELWVDPKQGRVARLAWLGKDVLAREQPAAGPCDAEIVDEELRLRPKAPPKGVTEWSSYRLNTSLSRIEVRRAAYRVDSSKETYRPHHVLRVAGDGLTLFPSAEKNPASPLLVGAGALWLAHDAVSTEATSAATSEPWIATIHDRLLLVRVLFDRDSKIEIRADTGSEGSAQRVVDVAVEPHSVVLPPDLPSSDYEFWYVREVPPSIKVVPGNPELVGFIKGLIE